MASPLMDISMPTLFTRYVMRGDFFEDAPDSDGSFFFSLAGNPGLPPHQSCLLSLGSRLVQALIGWKIWKALFQKDPDRRSTWTFHL